MGQAAAFGATSIAFGLTCREAGIVQSMGSTGDASDNAMVESFFATLEKVGRFEWITTPAGSVTHRMFVEGGKVNGHIVKP